jgi:predicted flap endonuclease-1-like 5' DNA nuclease
MDATVLWPTPRNFFRSLRFGFDVFVWTQRQSLKLFAPLLGGAAARPSPVIDRPSDAPSVSEMEAAEPLSLVEPSLDLPVDLPVDVPLDAPSAAVDDLTVIGGVGPKLAERLAGFGVTTFAQLAAWSPRDVASFEATLPVVQRGRVEREGWIAQARELSASHV